jgi:catechol 2,3-dioxygenase-like lactoylglutathione lyase family enzyme
MKIDHIAVASNSIEDSDKFFTDLLGLKKSRFFTVSEDLMEQFFGVKKVYDFARYDNDKIAVEVIITADDSKTRDIFTHSCLIVDDLDDTINQASSMGFTTIKVPRKDSGYYYFIKDSYGNLYELK